MICLSHPQLRPDVTRKAIRYYSQHFVDMLDLEQNQLVTKPLEEVLGGDFHSLRWVASVDDGDTIRPPLTLSPNIPADQLVVTFDYLLQRTDFVPVMKEVLTRLAEQYQLPVDVEFALSPVAWHTQTRAHVSPAAVPPPKSRHLARHCHPPGAHQYPRLQTRFFAAAAWCRRARSARWITSFTSIRRLTMHCKHRRDYSEVARLIGRLNKALEEHTFILLGPGRWGSSEYLQGVPVTYADIFNTRALVELASNHGGYTSEPSYGTHFFQDLVETQIFPLAVYLEDADDYLNWNFLAADGQPAARPAAWRPKRGQPLHQGDPCTQRARRVPS